MTEELWERIRRLQERQTVGGGEWNAELAAELTTLLRHHGGPDELRLHALAILALAAGGLWLVAA